MRQWLKLERLLYTMNPVGSEELVLFAVMIAESGYNQCVENGEVGEPVMMLSVFIKELKYLTSPTKTAVIRSKNITYCTYKHDDNNTTSACSGI
jgi:hypothetical protein